MRDEAEELQQKRIIPPSPSIYSELTDLLPVTTPAVDPSAGVPCGPCLYDPEGKLLFEKPAGPSTTLPRIPVGVVGVGEIHAAFLDESRTRYRL